ncbi:hypothetical protein M3Y99_01691600 [Aphelenchoides fujianensis]|nr:hypothetical protein M3Y99_01691600 [Aphelenchoides fujianensis]
MSHDVVNTVKVQRAQQRGAHSASLTGRRFQPPTSPPTARTLTFGFASGPRAPPEHTHQVIINAEPEAADFFIRLPDNQVIPLFCHCPSGSEADAFLQSLPERQREKLRGFLEIEKPEAGEFHIWIQEDEGGEITVISLKALENHLKNENVKRVKWRHSSKGNVSIYRYSVPVITTKFRLRIVHCCSRNYRCCILFVWCLVILFISLGIVGTVIFGGTATTGSGKFPNGHDHSADRQPRHQPDGQHDELLGG